MNKITVLLFVVFLSIFISDVNANTTKIKFSDNVIEEVNTLNILKADKILELVLKIDINVPESKILELSKYDVKIKKRIENILVIEIPSKNIDKLNKINWITFIRKSSHIIENCVDLNDKNINNNIYTKKKSLNKGKNVKIAIIDTGFKLENSSFSKKVKDYYCFECPRKVFSDGTQDLTNKENWIHGNAVAEIINKISPSADLYLLAVAKDPLDILTAIEHSVKYYKPDIISISINDSYPYDFFDGSGLYGKRIKNIVKKNNVILVSAGGNNVKNHFRDVFTPDENGYHNYKNGRFLFELEKDQSFVLSFAWKSKNFASSFQKYKFELTLKDSDGNDIKKAPIINDGSVYFTKIKVTKKDNYTLDIKVFDNDKNTYVDKSNLSENIPFHIFLYSNEKIKTTNFYRKKSLDPNIPVSEDVLTISAFDIYNPSFSDTNSSQGPTEDNRKKPDFAGLSNINTNAKSCFSGTSASAPYIAGIISNIISDNKNISNKNIRDYLKKHTKDIGKNGWDEFFGYGVFD